MRQSQKLRRKPIPTQTLILLFLHLNNNRQPNLSQKPTSPDACSPVRSRILPQFPWTSRQAAHLHHAPVPAHPRRPLASTNPQQHLNSTLSPPKPETASTRGRSWIQNFIAITW